MTKRLPSRTKLLLKSDDFHVQRNYYSTSNGQPNANDLVCCLPSFISIVLNNKSEIAFLKQAHPTTDDFLCLPKGYIREGKGVLDVATSELKKVLGNSITSVERLSFAPNFLSSISNEKLEILLSFFDSSKSDESTNKNIVWLSSNEVFSILHRSQKTGTPFYKGLFLDGQSVYALLIYKLLRKGL